MRLDDIDLETPQEPDKRGKRRRVELAFFEIVDREAVALELVFRPIFLAQAQKRDFETRFVEAGDHPRKEPLDPMHPRAFPPEVVANLQDFDFGHLNIYCSPQRLYFFMISRAVADQKSPPSSLSARRRIPRRRVRIPTEIGRGASARVIS